MDVAEKQVDARDNTSTNPSLSQGKPIYRLDGLLFANSNNDLWSGAIVNPLEITENGPGPGYFSLVWTGTGTDGKIEGGNGGLGFITPDFFTVHLVGATNGRGGEWVVSGHLPDTDLVRPLPFYAISGVVTVAPEPASLSLSALGCLVLLARRRRQNLCGHRGS